MRVRVAWTWMTLALTAGCGSAESLPKALPPLPNPPESAPEVPVSPLKDGEVTIVDEKHSEIAGGIVAAEPVHTDVTFKVPIGVDVPKIVLVQIGKTLTDGRFLIHAERSGVPVRGTADTYRVEVTIQGLQKAGSYEVQALADRAVFAKGRLVVKPPEE